MASFSFNVMTYWRTQLCKNILCGLFFGVAPKIFIWQPDLNHNFKFPLILDNYNIMIVMQKLKFMQAFTFAINVECLHSSLQANLLMHNCAHAKNAKNVFVAYKVI